jgi:hypothetical protein
MSDKKKDSSTLLQEREREILRKMSIAIRAGASQQVIDQMNWMLEEVRIQQFELKEINKLNDGDDFNDFISIG